MVILDISVLVYIMSNSTSIWQTLFTSLELWFFINPASRQSYVFGDAW